MKNFKIIFLLVFTFFISPDLYAKGTKDVSVKLGFKIMPVLQNVGPNSVWIMWESYLEDKANIKISLNNDLSNAKSIDETHISKIHKVKVNELLTSKKYYYCVNTNGQITKTESFITAPAKGSKTPFRFTVYGDSRTANVLKIGLKYGEVKDHIAVSKSMMSCKPNFVVHTGDLTYSGIQIGKIYEFFDIEKDFLSKTPFLCVYGNHEFKGGYKEDNTYWDDFLIPIEGGTFSWYGYTYGNTHFLMLNTNENLEEKQLEFIKSDLEKASSDPDIDHIMAVMHHPIYSGSYHGDSKDLIKTLLPLLKFYKVKIAFYGHDHDYQHLEKDGINYFLCGGGGAPIRTLSLGQKRKSGANQIVYKPCLNYLIVDVNGKSLHFEAIEVKDNGDTSVIETFDLKK